MPVAKAAKKINFMQTGNNLDAEMFSYKYINPQYVRRKDEML